MRPIYCNKSSFLDLHEGDKVQLPFGPYKIDQVVHGGMGVVILATCLDNENRIGGYSRYALKVTKGSLAKDKTFLAELAKWGLVFHNDVVLLKEIFWSESDGYIAASDVYPGNLRQLLNRTGKFSAEGAYAAIRTVAEALHYAHLTHGLLHLDVKPENILVSGLESDTKETQYTVTDWGISTVRQATLATEDNRFSNNAGTLPYMAPERLIAATASSPRSDIFGLGMVWLELRTGKLPFDLQQDLAEQILSGRYYPRARQLLEEHNVDRRSVDIILKAIYPRMQDGILAWQPFLKKLRPTLMDVILRR